MAARAGEHGGARSILLVLLFFLFGVGVGAFWFYRGPNRGPASAGSVAEGQPVAGLSDSTLAVLRRLNAPIDIRFYSLLEAPDVPDSCKAFAGRVETLLAEYQQAAPGKIRVSRIDTQSHANTNAALADGIKPVSTGEREEYFLGIALALQGQKESLAQLSPKWEQALEPDLTRAITRLLEAVRLASVSAPSPQVNTAAVQEVKALLPNPAAVSVEDGTRLLREAALKDYKAALAEMQARVKEAEQRFLQAQNGQSEADQQAALQHLKQVQAEQQAKLSEIAERSHDQIEAFKQLRAAAQ